MGKSAPSPPPPPDYNAAAQKQGEANIQAARVQAQLNNPDVYTPYGSQKVTQIYGGPTGQGAVKRFRIDQKLSPQQQRLFDLTERVKENLAGVAKSQLGRVAKGFSKPFDWKQVPGTPDLPEASEAVRQQVINALYNQQSSFLDPRYQQAYGEQESRLANQGIVQGSEAYQREIDNFNRQKALDYQQAMNSAIAGGGAEQSRLFGLGAERYQLGQQGRQQSIQEQEFARNIALNELNALRTGNQATLPQFQQFSGGGSIAAPDYFSAAQGNFGADRDLFNAQSATQAANTQGLYSLGGTAAGIGLTAAAIF